jgi:hypothetical protein
MDNTVSFLGGLSFGFCELSRAVFPSWLGQERNESLWREKDLNMDPSNKMH